MGMIEMEKKGTGYFFYKDCPQVETVIFFPEKAAYPFFLHELSTSRDCVFSSRKRKKAACPLFIKR